jgi:hypothetical protein
VHVDDVCQALMAALRLPIVRILSGTARLIASGCAKRTGRC